MISSFLNVYLHLLLFILLLNLGSIDFEGLKPFLKILLLLFSPLELYSQWLKMYKKNYIKLIYVTSYILSLALILILIELNNLITRWKMISTKQGDTRQALYIRW